VKPYYQDDHVTLYHGDCREILPQLDPVDLVLTDPPYGVAHTIKGGSSGGWGRQRDTSASKRDEWDASAPDDSLMRAVVAAGKEAVVWGGNYFPSLETSRGWLVWVKPERGFSLGEAELAWTSKDTVIRVYEGPRSDSGRWHPTQKPLSLMHWCLGHFPTAATVLDPFAGSGTTLRAAKDLGKRAIGIESDLDYCKGIVKRLAQEVLL
jgi:site-specific DNA-methyltransferase (adenine-specific)